MAVHAPDEPGDLAASAPTPRRFFIHDDLTDEVRARDGADSPAFRLTQELLTAVRRDAERVRVLTLEEQIRGVLEQGSHAPFEQTIGIGRAGERLARQLHERAGWFPTLRRVDVTREEDGAGGHRLVSTGGEPLGRQVAGLERCRSLAVVDDTIFSGLTMRAVLEAVPRHTRSRAHAFCLRAVAESLPPIRALCPVTVGFAAEGKIHEDVSFINASGLVLRVAIRRPGKPPLAFFERPAWMRAWFPGHADEIIALCRRLNALLERQEAAVRPPR